jgi:general secretion pathway protein G
LLCDCIMTMPRAAKENGREGVTLIELVCVIVIASILSGFALTAAIRSVNAGRVLRARGELSALSSALESYRRAFGDFPNTARGDILLQSLVGRLGPTGVNVESRAFVALTQITTGADRDPFVDTSAECTDPWGRPYQYAYKSTSPWTTPSFVLYSKGPDGADAGLIAGGAVDRTAAANLDNIWAEP